MMFGLGDHKSGGLHLGGSLNRLGLGGLDLGVRILREQTQNHAVGVRNAVQSGFGGQSARHEMMFGLGGDARDFGGQSGFGGQSAGHETMFGLGDHKSGDLHLGESLNTLGLGGLCPEQIGDSATPLQDAEDLQDEDDAVFASSDIRYR